MLTVVLTILADGGSGLQCQGIEGSMEIYQEDVEALGFLVKQFRQKQQKTKKMHIRHH